MKLTASQERYIYCFGHSLIPKATINSLRRYGIIDKHNKLTRLGKLIQGGLVKEYEYNEKPRFHYKDYYTRGLCGLAARLLLSPSVEAPMDVVEPICAGERCAERSTEDTSREVSIEIDEHTGVRDLRAELD